MSINEALLVAWLFFLVYVVSYPLFLLFFQRRK